VVVPVLELLGMVIVGRLPVSHLHLVKWMSSHFLTSMERPESLSQLLTELYATCNICMLAISELD
jgi:hypothetical protein